MSHPTDEPPTDPADEPSPEESGADGTSAGASAAGPAADPSPTAPAAEPIPDEPVTVGPTAEHPDVEAPIPAADSDVEAPAEHPDVEAPAEDPGGTEPGAPAASDGRGSESEPADGRGLLGRGRDLLAGIGDRVGDGWRAIRGRSEDKPAVTVDEDPDAEVVDGGVEPDPDLEALDAEGTGDKQAVLEGPDLDQPGGAALWGLFDRVDGGPELPVETIHSVGLGPLIRGLFDAEDPPALQEWAVDRVLGLLGDRYTLAVGPDGITVRGLLRRRHTDWDDIDAVRVINRFDALRSGLVARLLDYAIRVPIPGLRWLLERVFGAITDRLSRLVLGAEENEAWRRTSGWVLTDIERSGFDIQLDGPLLIVSLLAKGTTRAIVDEARRRDLRVEGAD